LGVYLTLRGEGDVRFEALDLAASLLACLAVAWLLWRFVERPSMRLAKHLSLGAGRAPISREPAGAQPEPALDV
jgi:peptidoglycan/LPS O-acetylase OafA/YrhL